MDADEYDYYDNLGESYFRVPDRDEDLFIQLEDVFPGKFTDGILRDVLSIRSELTP